MAVIDAFEPRDFSEVLGAMLTGVLDAQAKATRATIDFINEVGLEAAPGAATGASKLRTVTFAYRKLDESQTEGDFVLEVPLLSLVQIPMVSVKTAKLEFSYDVHRVEEPKADGASTAKKTMPRLFGKVPKRVASSALVRAEDNAGLKVTIELDRGTAPVGLDRLLDILEVAAADRQVPKPTSDDG